MLLIRLGFLAPVFFSLGVLGAVSKLEVDPAHSAITFTVKHMISKVPGRFGEFTSEVQFDPEDKEGKSWKARVEIESKSITTFNRERDRHLRSKDFFHVRKYPKITFESKGVKRKRKGKIEIKGDLTMHGVKREVMLMGHDLGKDTDPWGIERIGFHATTTIDRYDYGIRWNKALDQGGYMIGNEVDIELHVELIPKKEPPKNSVPATGTN